MKEFEFNLGREDFLRVDKDERLIYHFRDGEIFQFFGLKESFVHYIIVEDGIHKDIIFLEDERGGIRVSDVLVGTKSGDDFYCFRIRIGDPQIYALLYRNRKSIKLEWSSKEKAKTEWQERNGLVLPNLGTRVGRTFNIRDFYGRVLLQMRFAYFKDSALIQAVKGDSSFESEEVVNIDISQKIDRWQKNLLFEKFEQVLSSSNYSNNSLDREDMVDFCDYLQKLFSNFFPIGIVIY